ncbi:unnamed protein product [Polarella glacialis]|uniref:Uncharacterized protein n=1 Tax=Polarella glacialis TaxID=89957 RepID=A0A813ETG3_POLGL|nr:unnamed protein product [Polarella glacialis]
MDVSQDSETVPVIVAPESPSAAEPELLRFEQPGRKKEPEQQTGEKREEGEAEEKAKAGIEQQVTEDTMLAETKPVVDAEQEKLGGVDEDERQSQDEVRVGEISLSEYVLNDPSAVADAKSVDAEENKELTTESEKQEDQEERNQEERNQEERKDRHTLNSLFSQSPDHLAVSGPLVTCQSGFDLARQDETLEEVNEAKEDKETNGMDQVQEEKEKNNKKEVNEEKKDENTKEELQQDGKDDKKEVNEENKDDTSREEDQQEEIEEKEATEATAEQEVQQAPDELQSSTKEIPIEAVGKNEDLEQDQLWSDKRQEEKPVPQESKPEQLEQPPTSGSGMPEWSQEQLQEFAKQHSSLQQQFEQSESWNQQVEQPWNQQGEQAWDQQGEQTWDKQGEQSWNQQGEQSCNQKAGSVEEQQAAVQIEAAAATDSSLSPEATPFYPHSQQEAWELSALTSAAVAENLLEVLQTEACPKTKRGWQPGPDLVPWDASVEQGGLTAAPGLEAGTPPMCPKTDGGAGLRGART